jgi:hypothetical protein
MNLGVLWISSCMFLHVQQAALCAHLKLLIFAPIGYQLHPNSLIQVTLILLAGQ